MPGRDFLYSGVPQIEPQPVGAGDNIARRGVVQLCDVLYDVSFCEDARLECSVQIDQMQLSVVVEKYVGQVEIPVTKSGQVESSREVCKVCDELYLLFDVCCRPAVFKAGGQPAFESICVGDFFCDYKAAFFKCPLPLRPVGNHFGCKDIRMSQQGGMQVIEVR